MAEAYITRGHEQRHINRCSTKTTSQREKDAISYEIIRHSKSFMQELFSITEGAMLILLVDREGYIIEVIGNDNSKDLDLIHRFKVGTKLDTNLGKKHTACKILRAPIIIGDRTIGAINLICHNKWANCYTQGMVVATAKAISIMIEMENKKNELLYKNQCHKVIVNSITDGLLTVDKDGYLTYINEIGVEMLGFKGKNPIGRHVTELVDFKPVILEVLKTGKGYVDRDVIVTTSRGEKIRFIKTAVPIRDENGELIGVVDTFRKIKAVQNFVNHIIGSYADYCFDDIIGSSSNLAESIRLAKVAANSTSNVLIYGESGTGKELIAHSIHNAGNRRDKPFVSINCSAIPRELLESELFGYEGGAFTGALRKGRIGKFELADGGTLFLDEIGDMPLEMQVKLLRVIQERKITRIGGNNTFDIDVRLITATNKDLLKNSDLGQFRKDLYYRINVLNINLPPLRERKSDINELVDFFIHKMSSKLNKKVNRISQEALMILKQYDWPGNIRELENVIERAINICDGEEITKYVLPQELLEEDRMLENVIEFDTHKIEPLDVIEKRVIEKALYATSGNISNTASLLNITRNTVYNKMKKYNIQYM